MVAGKRGKPEPTTDYICSRCKRVEKRQVLKPRKNKDSVSYLETVSKISDQEAANGFVDEDGEKMYIVEDVIKYSSDGKFFVKWQGYPKTEGSWLNKKDMPKERTIKEKMLKLTKLYRSVAKASRAEGAQKNKK